MRSVNSSPSLNDTGGTAAGARRPAPLRANTWVRPVIAGFEHMRSRVEGIAPYRPRRPPFRVSLVAAEGRRHPCLPFNSYRRRVRCESALGYVIHFAAEIVDRHLTTVGGGIKGEVPVDMLDDHGAGDRRRRFAREIFQQGKFLEVSSMRRPARSARCSTRSRWRSSTTSTASRRH